MILPLILILCFMVGCQDKEVRAELEEFRAQAEVEDQNKEVVRCVYEAFNNANIEILRDLAAPDFAYNFPSATREPASKEGWIENSKNIFAAFPDFHYEIQDIAAKSDMVFIRSIIKETHKGEWAGISATGNKLEFSDIIIRIKDGKMAEVWTEIDMLTVYQQLGMELKPKEVE